MKHNRGTSDMREEQKQALRKRMVAECRNTVGYKEADDKKSFNTGMIIAIDKMMEEVEMEWAHSQSQERDGDHHREQLTIVADIFENYRTKGTDE